MVAPAVLLVPSAWVQLLALVLGALVGFCALTPPEQEPFCYKRPVVPLRRAVEVVFFSFALLLLEVLTELVQLVWIVWI